MKHPEERSGTSSVPIVSKIYTELFDLTDSIFYIFFYLLKGTKT